MEQLSSAQTSESPVSTEVQNGSASITPFSPSTTFPGSPPPLSTAMTAKSITLNPEQSSALEALLDFINDPDPVSWAFVLSGYAGTGKTFLMREVLARCSRSHVRFAFTAPTNKAAKVLREITGEACTIYSLLGLRIEKNGEFKELASGKTAIDLSELDIVVVDEGSMVNKKLRSHLQESADAYGFRVIFMGDPAQLPPVGETHSPIWEIDTGATLTQVMRYDNQILKLVTEIRVVVDSFTPCINVKADNANGEGVWKLSKIAFKEAVFNFAQDGGFADGSKGKVIAWRNIRVAEYNDLIRRAIFGAAAMPGNYLVGDRIIAAAPCGQGENQLLGTDDEAIVEGVIPTTHPLEPKYKAYELKCRTEDNRVIRLTVIHPSSQHDFENDCTMLAHQAKSNPKLWKKFWQLKELFHEIKYAYAITAHRSQGSTYESVFVDYQDVLLNRNRREAFQCLYVACSRPTKKLVLA